MAAGGCVSRVGTSARFGCLVGVVIAVAGCAFAPIPERPAPGGTTTLFYDDFSGRSLDLTKWQPNWLGPNNSAITKPVNSAEVSCYDPKQAWLEKGRLRLRAVTRPCTANNGTTYAHASGLVNTRKSFTFTYGTMEARMWLPPGTGRINNWPAFWANGTGKWPTTGELDVMEGLSSGRPCWHFHYQDANGRHQGPGGCASLPTSAGWHVFGARWEPGRITFIYDGAVVGTITQGVTSSPMYLIFNLGLAEKTDSPVKTPSTMLVDWVKVTRNV